MKLFNFKKNTSKENAIQSYPIIIELKVYVHIWQKRQQKLGGGVSLVSWTLQWDFILHSTELQFKTWAQNLYKGYAKGKNCANFIFTKTIVAEVISDYQWSAS
jgi:hypothetical protein